jgi:hypothetical protein
LLALPHAAAQDREAPPLGLSGGMPAGVRRTATESWGVFQFSVTNPTDIDRQARVLVFYEGQPDMQYGRDVWVPAQSILSSWMLVGPAAKQGYATRRDIQMLLYDRTGGQERLILPPGRERLRSRAIAYQPREVEAHKRIPFTALFIDEGEPEGITWGQLPQPEPTEEAVRRLVLQFRQARKLDQASASRKTGEVPEGGKKPAALQIVTPGTLPPTPEAYDSVDHFVIASGRIAEDPAGIQALRRWVELGGKVWVLLDRVEPEAISPLLGDALDFQIVDRVRLTTVKMVEVHTAGPIESDQSPQQLADPVDFVRVLLPPGERVPYTVNGWPAWFVRSVGRGKVVFSTVGPQAWSRPRTQRDPALPPEEQTGPIPIEALDSLGAELDPPKQEERFPLEAFKPVLNEQIGHTALGRSTVGLVFGGFLLATVGLGIILRKSRRPELLGWLAPVVALAVMGVFLGLGLLSRRSAVPTVAVAQIVDADSGTAEAPVHGILQVYRSESGPAELSAQEGGLFELDLSGTEGQARRLILTDRQAWHWENVSLPADERLANFHYTVPTGTPITARAHFGPEGLEGRVAAGPFRDLADALLSTPTGRNLAVRMRPDGSFTAGSSDILPSGQFLEGAILSDRQQRRQELYQEFLKRSAIRPQDARNVLLAWAQPVDMHFTLAPEARQVGSALLVIPLQWEYSLPGTQVTVPGPLIPYRRLVGRGEAYPTTETDAGLYQELRFQLPSVVLPLKLERVRVSAKIRAPSRRVTLAGKAGAESVEVYSSLSPLDPFQVDITDERLLHLDDSGGLHLNLTVGDLQKGGPELAQDLFQQGYKWTIEYLEIEATGRTEKEER